MTDAEQKQMKERLTPMADQIVAMSDDEREALRGLLRDREMCCKCWEVGCTGWCDYDSVWEGEDT